MAASCSGGVVRRYGPEMAEMLRSASLLLIRWAVCVAWCGSHLIVTAVWIVVVGSDLTGDILAQSGSGVGSLLLHP